MAKLFPFRPDREHETAGPRLVNLQDDGASDVFAALSADTARDILSRIYESPATASDVAEAADTSIQNARYHLEKLESAGLVEAVDTWYSSRGTEMTVYGPTNEPLVVAAGDEESQGILKRALERVVGAVALLAVASLLFDRLVGRIVGPGSITGQPEPEGFDVDPTGPDSGTATTTPEPSLDAATNTPLSLGTQGQPGGEDVGQTGTESTSTIEDFTNASASASPDTPVPSLTETLTTTPDQQLVADGGTEILGSIPPGAVFFAGGLAVVTAVSAWWYVRQYKPMYG